MIILSLMNQDSPETPPAHELSFVCLNTIVKVVVVVVVVVVSVIHPVIADPTAVLRNRSSTLIRKGALPSKMVEQVMIWPPLLTRGDFKIELAKYS
jgi:hypothetical protein